MIILQGILRQAGEISLGKDKPVPYVKLWVEHEEPRFGDGPSDLKISELLIPKAEAGPIPSRGETVAVSVRCYVSGRDVAYSALAILPQAKPTAAAK